MKDSEGVWDYADRQAVRSGVRRRLRWFRARVCVAAQRDGLHIQVAAEVETCWLRVEQAATRGGAIRVPTVWRAFVINAGFGEGLLCCNHTSSRKGEGYYLRTLCH